MVFEVVVVAGIVAKLLLEVVFAVTVNATLNGAEGIKFEGALDKEGVQTVDGALLKDII